MSIHNYFFPDAFSDKFRHFGNALNNISIDFFHKLKKYIENVVSLNNCNVSLKKVSLKTANHAHISVPESNSAYSSGIADF